ncbi:MAG: hypothetical protein EPO68_04505 [Planctomycetota bacterium]|nr:MAG: hypothetical protein EPO68_04505 [Planctomycetota bacterium]
MSRPALLAAALAVCAAFPASGQTASDVYLVETTQDQLVRLTDLDGDGKYLSSGEVRALFYDDMLGANFSSPRSVFARMEGPKPVLYWIDTQRDLLFRATDDSGNGRIDLGEESRFRLISTFDGETSPDGLAPTADSAVWWCSDAGQALGLFRCIDLNGDGDANDAGESEKMIDGASANFVGTDLGPVPLDGAALLRLASSNNVVIAYVQGDDEALMRFERRNSDADLADPGESRLYLNAAGKSPALPQNADWANGQLRSLVLPAPGGKGFVYGKLCYLCSRDEGGVTAWYFATNQPAGFNALNTLGQAVNGLVYRGVDLNSDEDLQDAGEVRLYYDGSTTSGAPFQIDQITGLDASPEGIYVGAIDQGDAVVHRLRDTNSDGDASDAGEQTFKAFDYATFAGPSPFFIGNPWVWDIAAAPNGWLQNYFQDSGVACAPTAAKPILGFVGDTHVAHPGGIEVRVESVPGGMPAFLSMGSSTTSWFGFPLPFDLGAVGMPGCFLYQNALVQMAAVTTGVGPTGGVAKKSAVLANDPTLYGVDMPLQWIVFDVPTSSFLFSKLGVIHVLAP